jgi:hypothetical protein
MFLESMASLLALLDTDVLIKLFERLYCSDKKLVKSAVEILSLRFQSAWIAATVKNEFCGIQWRQRRAPKKKIKKIEKIISFVNKFSPEWLTLCPVTVGEREIELIRTKKLHPGEIDSLLQAKKVLSNDRLKIPFQAITFISDDDCALEYGEKLGVNCEPFEKIQIMFGQMGIVVPG